MGLFSEFKKFAFKGNVVDMAVGVVVGGAFGTIVTSLVKDIIMPAVGLLFPSGKSLSDLKLVLQEAVMDGETVVTPENALLYGQFIQNVVYFFIIAFSIFIVVRLMNRAREAGTALAGRRKKKDAAPEAPAEPPAPPAPTSEELLAEIRDLLKKERGE